MKEMIMRSLLILVFLVASYPVFAEKSADEQIREAVRAFPEALRAEATVVG